MFVISNVLCTSKCIEFSSSTKWQKKTHYNKRNKSTVHNAVDCSGSVDLCLPHKIQKINLHFQHIMQLLSKKKI